MTPNYIAKKSAWAAWSLGATLLTVLLSFLIVPIIVQICRTITVKKYSVEFYDDKIIVKSGWLNTHSKQMVFMGVTSVSISQSLWGNMFGYGDVIVDCVGKWDVDTHCIKKPHELEEYLQTRIVQASMHNQFVHM